MPDRSLDDKQTAFYVTDSATHQNRPLYFRQDDWKALTAPLLEALGKTVFERVPDVRLLALSDLALHRLILLIRARL